MPGVVEGFAAIFWLSLAALGLLSILVFFGAPTFFVTAVAALVVIMVKLLN